MSDITLDAQPTVLSRWSSWLSPLVTLGTLLAMEVLRRIGLPVAGLVPVMLLGMVITAYVGGLGMGLASAGLISSYAWYALAQPASLASSSADSVARALLLLLSSVVMAALGSSLKQSSAHEHLLRMAAEDTQPQLDVVATQQVQDLHDQQRWLEAILNVMPTPLLLIEPGTARVQFANKAADRLAGGTFPKDAPAEEYHRVYYCTDANGERIPDEQMPGVRAARGERLEHFEMDWHTEAGTHALIVQSETLPAIHAHPATVVLSFQDVTPLKRAQNISSRLGRILDHASNEIYIFDAATLRFLQANRSACASLGYSVEELAELTPLDLQPRFTRAQFEELIGPLRSGERDTVLFETVQQRKDGTRYPVEVRLQLSQAEAPPVFVTIVQDLSMRVEAEAALHESEARFRILADSAPVLLWMADITGLCTFFNQQWLTFTGRELEQELGDGWLQGVHPDDRARNKDTFMAALNQRERFGMEYRLQRADGAYRWVLDTGVPRYAPDGAFVGYIGSCVDLTDRRQLETALQQKTIEQEVLLNSMPALVYYKDRDCRYVAVNQAFAELTQQSLDAVSGQTDFDLFAPEEAAAFRRDDLVVLETGRPLLNIEETITSAAGITSWYATHKTPYRDPQGNVVGLVGISTNILVRKQVEQQLREQTETLALLNHVGKLLSAELDLQKLVQAVTDAATTLTGAQFGAFFYNVVAEHKESYMLYTLSGVDPAAFAQFPMPRNTEVFGPTFRNEGIIRVDDITKDPRYGRNRPYNGMPKNHLPVTSYMAVPVVSRSGDVLGGLFFGHPEPGRFTEREEQLIIGLTSQAAIAMDNARLYQAEQEARRATERAIGRVARLQAITAALAEALSMDQVSEIIVQQGISPLGAYAGVVALLSNDGSRLDVVRAVGYAADVLAEWSWFSIAAPMPLAEAVRTGAPVWLASQAEQLARYSSLAEVNERTQSQAIAAIPLVSEGRSIGALGFSFAEPQAFSADDQAFMLAIARQCSQALERARLYESERQARALAEAAEREKEEARALLDTIFQAAPVGLGFFSRDFRFVRVNEALAAMHGVAVEQEIGQLIRDVLPSQAPQLEQLISTVLATGQPIRRLEVSAAQPQSPGRVRHWLASYYLVAARDATPLGVGLATIEVTERKRAEESQKFIAEASALLVASLDYETTLQSVARLAVPRLADWCAVDILDEDGTLRRLAVTHIDPAKVELAHDLHQRFPPNPNSPHSARAVIRTGRADLLERIPDQVLTEAAPNNEWLEIVRGLGLTSSVVVPLTTGGRTLGAITFVTAESGRVFDTTDLALAEELGRRAAVAVDNARLYQDAQEAILARDDFLSIASHELKTPITALQLQAQNLLRVAQKGDISKLSPERLTAKLTLINEQTNRLTYLANDLLDVARIKTGRIDFRPEEFDLGQVVHDVAARFDEQLAQVGCVLSIEADGPMPMRSDRARLEQVIINLLSNAIKYGAGNPISICLDQAQGIACLSISDQGIGIAPEHLERIFVRFERAVSSRNYGGLGLGLYIVRQIVEALGGTVSVSSVVGAGSTFVVRLPLVSPQLAGAGSGSEG